MKKSEKRRTPRRKETAGLAIFLEAVSFAARAHEGQKRRDGQTPYISHPMRVAMILRHLFGVKDETVLAAAVLHDVLEDTRQDYDDLAARFGERAASYAAMLSKDNRLPEPLRESSYLIQLKSAPLVVKLIKTADFYDNLRDSSAAHSTPREQLFKRARAWLKVLAGERDERAVRARHHLAGLLAKI
ncbi:MAG: bifunctional (p)ppGpp synthetase/guanosine-3',5'-bis(diphosphate) 3'-pyrophosphohydrolase [Candidatus Omnitrophica bacterium]|nr:bifunctional (p)ppGpp synthetase/guanosine-3',5'-bis(diphosphate) 3'-pyrophosphohydrolase [Candidatus Omnitrophota bacterium]